MRIVDASSLKWVGQFFPRGIDDPRPYEDELRQHPSKAAAWLAMMLVRPASELWNALVQSQPDFLDQIWQAAFSAELSQNAEVPKRLILLFGANKNSGFAILTPTRFSVGINEESMDFELPVPSEDWRVKIAQIE